MLSGMKRESVQELEINLKDEFPIKQTTAYFNNASYTPMSRRATLAIISELENYASSGPSDEYYLRLKEAGWESKRKLRKILNVEAEDMVLTESATQSINLIANGFKFQKGDIVITRGGANEHPSNYLPWKYYVNKKGAGIVDLKVDAYGFPDLSELDSALKATNAKLVVMSHVLYNYGSIMPAAEVSRIAHERGALFFLDASQSVGNIKVDLKAIDPDFAAGTAAKWLCGPLGLAFLYCKNESLQNLEPLNFGPNSCTYTPFGDYNVLETAQKMQEGFRNWVYSYGLSSAIDLVSDFGQDKIRERSLYLADIVIEFLSHSKCYRLLGTTDQAKRTSITPVETVGIRPIEIVQRLAKSNILIAEREILDKKILRISPHFYNDEEETARVIEALNSACT
jgi:cysteine desulfurase / selenocysteine lyase